MTPSAGFRPTRTHSSAYPWSFSITMFPFEANPVHFIRKLPGGDHDHLKQLTEQCRDVETAGVAPEHGEPSRGAHAAAVRPLRPSAMRSAQLCRRHFGLGGLFNRSDRVSAGSYVCPYVAGDLMLLVKSGFRFSKKAVNASFASLERTCTLNSSFSAFIAALICSRNGCFMSLLQACSALAGLAATFSAVSVALARTSLSDMTWVTSPNSAARPASKDTPNRISSAARR